MQTATRPLTNLWTAVRTQLRDSLDKRSARSALERELASYTSPADLDDLYAILDRYSDRETAGIRRILIAQRGDFSPR